MTLSRRLLVSIALLAGCDPSKVPDSAAPADSDAPEPAPAPSIWECDPAVTVPAGLLSADGPVAALPHDPTLGDEPAPYAVRYQWPDADPSDSASFLWRTDADTLASAVRYGPADTFPEAAVEVQGYSFLFGGPTVGEGSYRIHEARLCDALTPGTAYSYQVGGEGAWSDTYSFTTPGAPGSFDTFKLGIAGDSRGAYETWGQVLAAMDAHEPDLLLFTGDMVEVGSVQAEWDEWFAAGGDVLARRPLLPAHGNHEFLSQNYFAQFGLPGNEEWYAARYGDLLLVSLNDTVRDSEQIATEQAAFLEEVLSATDARWKVVIHHQAAYSACSTHGSDEDVRDAWAPIFDEHGVDVVIAGHNHLYERSVPIKGGAEVAPGEGTIYLVSGGAGAPLYTSIDEEWFGAVADPVVHYVLASFGPDGAAFEVRDLAGNLVDSFALAR